MQVYDLKTFKVLRAYSEVEQLRLSVSKWLRQSNFSLILD